jgi:hypothetical protein
VVVLQDTSCSVVGSGFSRAVDSWVQYGPAAIQRLLASSSSSVVANDAELLRRGWSERRPAPSPRLTKHRRLPLSNSVNVLRSSPTKPSSCLDQ